MAKEKRNPIRRVGPHSPFGLAAFSSVASKMVTRSLPIPVAFTERAASTPTQVRPLTFAAIIKVARVCWQTLIGLFPFLLFSLNEFFRCRLDLLNPCCPASHMQKTNSLWPVNQINLIWSGKSYTCKLKYSLTWRCFNLDASYRSLIFSVLSI